ncbi:MAG: hypothetical protein WCA82_02185 [Jiangellales bacterium]
MPDAPTADETSTAGLRELLVVVILSITTVLTAWSGFQSSKWGGAMSIAFSEASSSRIEAARQDGTANQRTALQVGLWTQWVNDVAAEDERLATFIEARFPEPLATAQRDWLATDPVAEDGTVNPDAPASPFDMESYVLPERVAAQEADARADERFADALANNQRGDNYTLLTVLFAAVLFFTAMSARMDRARSQWALLSFAVALGVVGVAFLITFPKLV